MRILYDPPLHLKLDTMLCTYIRDTYKKTDASVLAAAIDNICSPLDSYGWSSSGLYSFWSPYSNEVLYIGLAVELASRFKQHNSLKYCPENGCKKKLVEEWFSENDELGYSVLVQSSISQPLFSGNSAKKITDKFRSDHPELFYGIDSTKLTEGLLLSACGCLSGMLPRWNRVGGSRKGAMKATADHAFFAKLFSNEVTDASVALHSIREISDSPVFEMNESYLHGVRQLMVLYHLKFNEAWDAMKEIDNSNSARDCIIETNYLQSMTSL